MESGTLVDGFADMPRPKMSWLGTRPRRDFTLSYAEQLKLRVLASHRLVRSESTLLGDLISAQYEQLRRQETLLPSECEIERAMRRALDTGAVPATIIGDVLRSLAEERLVDFPRP